METTVKQRLESYLEKNSIKDSDFCRAISVSQGYISGMRKSIQPDKLKSIAINYPSLNIGWLMTGVGNMEISTTQQRESDSSLYHYTKSYEGLISIMNNKIKPQYSIENFDYIEDGIRIAVPVFCFCDIPIERHSAHKKKYGEYGIGFKKEWAKNLMQTTKGERPNLSLVHYITYGSVSAVALRLFVKKYKAINQYISENRLDDDIINGIRNAFSIILMLAKPYENKDGSDRYYDEKEWRYVYFDESKLKIPLSVVADNNKDEIDESQYKINDEPNAMLDFTVDDITHIFLKTEEDREDFIRNLIGYTDNEIAKINGLIRVSAKGEVNEKKEVYDEKYYKNKYLEQSAKMNEILLENRDLNKEIKEALQKTISLQEKIISLDEELGEIKNELVAGVSDVVTALTRIAL
jgi:hypothetical protein